MIINMVKIIMIAIPRFVPQFSVTLAACLLFILGAFKSAAITPPVRSIKHIWGGWKVVTLQSNLKKHLLGWKFLLVHSLELTWTQGTTTSGLEKKSLILRVFYNFITFISVCSQSKLASMAWKVIEMYPMYPTAWTLPTGLMRRTPSPSSSWTGSAPPSLRSTICVHLFSRRTIHSYLDIKIFCKLMGHFQVISVVAFYGAWGTGKWYFGARTEDE